MPHDDTKVAAIQCGDRRIEYQSLPRRYRVWARMFDLRRMSLAPELPYDVVAYTAEDAVFQVRLEWARELQRSPGVRHFEDRLRVSKIEPIEVEDSDASTAPPQV